CTGTQIYYDYDMGVSYFDYW
nr:immunoglobulin heavy chain junction region [Mus musculus]